MKVVISLSGGRDSATVLGLAVYKYGAENIFCMGFEYGSKHPCELEAAKKIASYYQVSYQTVKINPRIFDGSTSTLLSGRKEVETGKTYEQILNDKKGPVDTYVPARNTLFSAFCLAKAESLSQQFGGEHVLVALGQHADDSGFDENGVLDASKAAYPDAVKKGSKILMGDGLLKNIEDVKIGDEIFSFDEKTNSFSKNKVMGVWNKGKKKVYNCCNDLWVSENHIMWNRGKNKFVPYSKMNRKNAIYKIPTVNENLYYINNIHLFNKGYLHGFIDGDGYKHEKSIQACQNKKDVLEELGELWREEYNENYINNIHSKSNNMFYIILGNSNNYYNDSLSDNKDYMLGYLNGIMIAEGSCTFNKADHSVNFSFCQSTLVNKQKCNLIDTYLQKLNFKNIQWTNKKGVKTWRFNKAYRFPLKYGRTKKDELINNFIPHYTQSCLKSGLLTTINYANQEEEECYDLTTESGTFIANGVLVHNCSKEFTDAFAKVAGISSSGKVSYWTPFIKMRKWQLMRLGSLLNRPVPYHLCISCYQPIQNEKGEWTECGKCATDLDVQKAIKLANESKLSLEDLLKLTQN